MLGWKVLFWTIVIYVLFTFIYFFVKRGKYTITKNLLRDLRHYIFGYMELEKLYIEKMFESGIENDLSKIEIRDKYRKNVKNNSESIKIPDFPTEEVSRRIRKQIYKL